MSIDFTHSFSIKPDTARVKQIRSLNDFINEYPDEELIPNLIMLNQKYQYYRPICGDGNCFYRACIFFYFTSVDLTNYNILFPYAPVKNCINLPFQFDDFNVEQILNYIWKQFLLPLSNLDRFQRQKQLGIKLNSSLLLDAFLIAYFRSLNHRYLTQNIQKFTAFAQDDSDREYTSVLTYSRQSQGIQLFAMAQFLNMKITIMMVHRLNFQQIVYRQGGRGNNILFFRPGHYDIICTQQEYKKQASSIKRTNSPALTKKWSRPNHVKVEPSVVKINNLEDLSKYSTVKKDSKAKPSKPLENTCQLSQLTKTMKIQNNAKYYAPQPSPIKITAKNSPSKKQTKSKILTHQDSTLRPKKIEVIPPTNRLKLSFEIVILVSIFVFGVATITCY